MLFAACAFAGELISLKVVTRGAEGEVTTSTTFAFAALLAAGPACAVVALICASFAADVIQRKAPLKLLFNAVAVRDHAHRRRARAAGLHGRARASATQFHFAPADLPGILAAATVFFLVNSSLVATVIALVQGLRIGRHVVQDWFFQVSTGGLMLGLAPMVALAADFALPSVALLFLPLLAVHRGGRQAIAKEHQALHDALTGLPNRSLFRHRIEQVRQRRPPRGSHRRRDADRPRSLQGDQRHARPPRRRPAAAGGVRAPARVARGAEHGRAPRRRRVRRAALRPRQLRGGERRRARPAHAAARAVPRSKASRSRSTPASASRARPSTARPSSS